MLTAKQQQLLLFIHDRLQQSGISPSFDEMKDALGLKSKSGIHRLIGALEERGFLRRMANRARALEVIKLPDGIPQTAPSDSATIIQGTFGTQETPAPSTDQTLDIPPFTVKSLQEHQSRHLKTMTVLCPFLLQWVAVVIVMRLKFLAIP